MSNHIVSILDNNSSLVHDKHVQGFGILYTQLFCLSQVILAIIQKTVTGSWMEIMQMYNYKL